MKKKIISIVCAFCIVFSLVSCDNSEEEYRNALTQEISALTEQISSLTEQINDLTGELEALKAQQSADSEELQAQNEELQKQLQEQTEEMELMQKKLENLMGLPIEFTAEKPVFLEKSILTDYIQIYKISTEKINTYDTYSLAKAYYQEFVQPNLDEDIFLLKHIGAECTHPSCYFRDYHFYSGNENTAFHFVINTNMRIYVEELGRIEYDINEIPDGYHAWSLQINAYLLPVPKDKYQNYFYRLEFGHNPNQSSIYTHYINVYAQDVYTQENCIATYYYLPNAYISKTWFENYFKENLLRSNN